MASKKTQKRRALRKRADLEKKMLEMLKGYEVDVAECEPIYPSTGVQYFDLGNVCDTPAVHSHSFANLRSKQEKENTM